MAFSEYQDHPLTKKFIRDFPKNSVYKDRLSQELELIAHFRFEKVFYQVLDILELSKGIPHIVRGSAGASLVCYLLGITHIDPVKEKIRVARFMNKFRKDIPDIDIDFPYDKRDEIINKLRAVYGERAVRISNHIRFKQRSALREAIREHGYRKFLPKYFDIKKIFPDSYEKILKRSKELIGTFRGHSLHCGGVVIFDEPVKKELLLKKGQIKYDKNEVEKKGLIKIDLLCNRGLAQLFCISNMKLEDYPETDELTSNIFCKGDVLGITFSESPAMRRVVRAIKPQSRKDLAICLALVRPAAASRGRKAIFLKNWQKTRKQTQIVYDDDANTLISYLTGLSPDEADYYRRGFAKGHEETIKDFIGKIKTTKNSQKYIEDLRMMRDYSFCKAHAISYSFLVWGLAYWKARDPKSFWHAALLHCQSMYAPWVHIMESKRAGLKLVTPGPNWERNNDDLFNARKNPFLFDDQNAEYKKYGYWLSPRFVPNCKAITTREKIHLVGIIATYRRYRSETSSLTFVTVGTSIGNYWDLVLQGDHNLYHQDIIEVKGTIKYFFNSKYVEVKNVLSIRKIDTCV